MMTYGLVREGLVDQIDRATPEMLTEIHGAADRLRWWVGRVEWIETLVRARDWPPGRGMPRAAFDPDNKDRLLCELYVEDEDMDGLLSPRAFVRGCVGEVV